MKQVTCEATAQCRAGAKHIVDADGEGHYPFCDRHVKTLPKGYIIVHSSPCTLFYRPHYPAHRRDSYIDPTVGWVTVGQRVAWMGSRTAALRIGHVVDHRLSIVSIEWDEKNPDFMPRFTHWTEREFLTHERLGHLHRLSDETPNLEAQ